LVYGCFLKDWLPGAQFRIFAALDFAYLVRSASLQRFDSLLPLLSGASFVGSTDAGRLVSLNAALRAP